MDKQIKVNMTFADGETRSLEIERIDTPPLFVTFKKKRWYLRRMRYLGYKEWCRNNGVTPKNGRKYYRAQARRIIEAMISERKYDGG